MAQIGYSTLAALSRRLATTLSAGIDVRSAIAREATRGSGRAQTPLKAISAAIATGSTVGDAVAAQVGPLPPLFCELVRLGDQTGGLPDVFARLADHYEHQVRLRRQFLTAITWPMIQLTLAVSIVGFLIWVMGAIAANAGGEAFDMLGFGLIGNRGLAIYLVIVAGIVVAVYGLIRVVTSEAVWTGPVQRVLYRLPVIGNLLSNIALARLTWALGMALEGGMDVKQALSAGLRSTHSAIYTAQIPEVLSHIDQRQTIYDALASSGVLPGELLDSVDVGEQSGQLPEVLLRLSDDYQERAKAGMSTAATLGGFAVWGCVALLIVTIIFRIFSWYTGQINNAAM